MRSLINEAEPDIEEEAKWRKASNPDGVPTFSRDGLVCTLETYKDKVKLTFAKGASLADPTGIFNASLDAGTRRAVDLFEGDDARRPRPSWRWSARRSRSTRRECGPVACLSGCDVGQPRRY